MAVDVTKIDRTIAKEPAYKVTPQYCLLLLGAEGKTRVWLVLDGNTLYVDKNGNGDLTEPDEAVSAFEGSFAFQIDAIRDRNGTTKHVNLHVYVHPEDEERPGYWALNIDVEDRYRQYAFAHSLTNKPQEASVVHFGGPLEMGMRTPEEQTLVHGDKPSELCAWIATKYPGVEWAAVDHGKGVPEDVHPIAEITFPGKMPDAKAITLKVPLTQRC